MHNEVMNYIRRVFYFLHIYRTRYCAFTLAEVLITLGIIGVVAALTMPSLIQNYQKKKAVTQLKAAYSILSQAFERAKADYGDMEYWGMESWKGQTTNSTAYVKDFIETYFLPYIKPLKNYGTTTMENIGYDNIYNLDKSFNNGSKSSQQYIISLSNGTLSAFSLDGHCDTYHKDSNGNTVCDSPWYFTNIYIIVDTNGIQKPNTYGKDIFVMTATNNKFKFYSYSNNENDRTQLLKYCSKGNSENRMCGRLIQLDGWEINYEW